MTLANYANSVVNNWEKRIVVRAVCVLSALVGTQHLGSQSLVGNREAAASGQDATANRGQATQGDGSTSIHGNHNTTTVNTIKGNDNTLQNIHQQFINQIDPASREDSKRIRELSEDLKKTAEAQLDILRKGIPEDAHPYINFSEALTGQIRLFAEDHVRFFGGSEQLAKVQLGSLGGWHDFKEDKEYVVVGVENQPIVPEFKTTQGLPPRQGGVKVEVRFTRYRNQVRDPRDLLESSDKPTIRVEKDKIIETGKLDAQTGLDLFPTKLFPGDVVKIMAVAGKVRQLNVGGDWLTLDPSKVYKVQGKGNEQVPILFWGSGKVSIEIGYTQHPESRRLPEPPKMKVKA